MNQDNQGSAYHPFGPFGPATTVPQNQRPPRRTNADRLILQRIVQWYWEGIALPEVAGDGLATHLASAMLW